MIPNPISDRKALDDIVFDILGLTEDELKKLPVRSLGIEIKGKRVIDIVCGTGIYTLPIDEEAAYVLGVDITLGMLNRLFSEAQKIGITNVDTLTCLVE